MMLNVSLDGGSTWAEYAPALMDFDRYLATLLRFVESDHEKHERLKVPRIALVPAMPAEVLAMYAGSNSKSNTKGGSPEEKTGSAIASGGRG